MTSAQALLTELRSRHIELIPEEGNALRYRAPKGTVTPDLRQALADHKAELLTILRLPVKSIEPTFDPDAGELAAFKLMATAIGDVWFVADAEALADHPDIIRAGLPVFFFDEVNQMRGKTVAQLHAIGMVKGTFSTARVLQ
ncbi:MAG: hypothetical protein HY270_04380 [Deltaproteobacteria bacterium]|nr:hypothetical protein [Deltaproteobacteria bacterium]